MKELAILKSEMQICDLHVQRIQMALHHLQSIFPITPAILKALSEKEIGFLELLTSRFAKLQDTIGQKVFPLLLILVREDIQNKTFIDRLNKLEKIGALKSVAFWDTLRDIRNSIAHEYPDDPALMSHRLNLCQQKAKELVTYWDYLKKFMSDKHIW